MLPPQWWQDIDKQPGTHLPTVKHGQVRVTQPRRKFALLALVPFWVLLIALIGTGILLQFARL